MSFAAAALLFVTAAFAGPCGDGDALACAAEVSARREKKGDDDPKAKKLAAEAVSLGEVACARSWSECVALARALPEARVLAESACDAGSAESCRVVFERTGAADPWLKRACAQGDGPACRELAAAPGALSGEAACALDVSLSACATWRRANPLPKPIAAPLDPRGILPDGRAFATPTPACPLDQTCGSTCEAGDLIACALDHAAAATLRPAWEGCVRGDPAGCRSVIATTGLTAPLREAAVGPVRAGCAAGRSDDCAALAAGMSGSLPETERAALLPLVGGWCRKSGACDAFDAGCSGSDCERACEYGFVGACFRVDRVAFGAPDTREAALERAEARCTAGWPDACERLLLGALDGDPAKRSDRLKTGWSALKAQCTDGPRAACATWGRLLPEEADAVNERTRARCEAGDRATCGMLPTDPFFSKKPLPVASLVAAVKEEDARGEHAADAVLAGWVRAAAAGDPRLDEATIDRISPLILEGARELLPRDRARCALGEAPACARLLVLDPGSATSVLREGCAEGRAAACAEAARAGGDAALATRACALPGAPDSACAALRAEERLAARVAACDARDARACAEAATGYWNGVHAVAADPAAAVELFARACGLGARDACDAARDAASRAATWAAMDTSLGADDRWRITSFTAYQRRTGLTWERAVVPVPRDFAAAKAYCAELTLDRHGDWRLPTAAELKALATDLPDPDVFPGTSQPLWSSDAQGGASASVVRGGESTTAAQSSAAAVRCVR